MTPEALALAEQRIDIDVREAARRFARIIAQKQEELGGRGIGVSSRAVLVVHELARAELEERALGALRMALRVFAADDTEPSDASHAAIIALVRRAIEDQSADVDAAYRRPSTQMAGSWPTLEEPRTRALEVATSELDIAFMARRRAHAPLGDQLRAPRYAASYAHWTKALTLASQLEPDFPNAIKEAVTSLEALARVVVPKSATLGDAIKTLRAEKRIEAGVDKLLEGAWTYASATPGVRHGAGEPPLIEESDWHVMKPMIDAALRVVLSADVPGAS